MVFIIAVLVARSATAALPCAEQLKEVRAEWIAVLGDESFSSDAAPFSPRHPHTGPEFLYVRDQFSQAALLCGAGKDHEALLRLDLVRAWLKLPEVQHPAEHRYLPGSSDDE